MKLFENTDVGIVRFMKANIEERKILHDFAQIQNVYSGGILCESLPHEGYTHKECYECFYKKVPLKNYHYGLMANNKDEWKSGTCPKCGEFITHECNYDDNAFYMPYRNVFAVGQCFTSYFHPEISVKVSEEKILQILDGKTIYEVEIPQNLRKREKIGKAIDAKKLEWRTINP